MKITMENGFTFEGTQAEYEAFMAFAEAQMGEQEAEYIPQEGDIVVVTNTEGLPMFDYFVGDVVKIVDTDCGEPSPLRVIKPNTQSGYTNAKSIRKATPAEVDAYEKALADASKPKLKAGDFVKITEKSHYFTPDKLYEVFEKDGVLLITDDDGDELYAVLEVGSYKLATAEEVAKHADEAKWAKIGRKDDEYKVGDIVEIVRYQYGANVGEIVKIDDVDADGVHYPHHEGATGFGADYDAIKLITPVESTLN